MFSQQFYIMINFLMVADAVILIITGYAAYSISLEWGAESLVMAWTDFIGSVLFLMFLNNYLMGRSGFYSIKRFRTYWVMFFALFRVVALDFIILATGVLLIGVSPVPRVFIVQYFIYSFIVFLMVRLILYYYLDNFSQLRFNAWKILLVGNEKRIGLVASVLEKQKNWGHQVVGCVSINGEENHDPGDFCKLGEMKDFDNVLREYEIDEVIFALPREYPVKLEQLLIKCEEIGVAFRIVPGLFDINNQHHIKADSLLGIPTLTRPSLQITASGLFYKRILDLAGGLSGFIILLLIYPFIGLAIKLNSPGPVFFKQLRIGKNGRRFYLFKFRTMVMDAEAKKSELMKHNEMTGPIFKVEDDPRITSVGKFLRKTSLDEMPQFINVLRGEMSLVGTRPPTPDEVQQYEDWHLRRISTKPGITGLWQISGRNAIKDFTEVVKLDLQYIDSWRFATDLWILWRTVWVVLARKGAK